MAVQLDWEHHHHKPHPGLPPRELVLPTGTLRVPGTGPRPQSDSFMSIVPTKSWEEVVNVLVQFWVKVATTFPTYYNANISDDVQAALERNELAKDERWDRVVCLIDIIYGKVTTSLWCGNQMAKWNRTWVIVRFPMIDDLCRSFSDEDFEKESEAVNARLREALIVASKREPAQSAISSLQRWRKCSLWMMDEESPETLFKIEI